MFVLANMKPKQTTILSNAMNCLVGLPASGEAVAAGSPECCYHRHPEAGLRGRGGGPRLRRGEAGEERPQHRAQLRPRGRQRARHRGRHCAHPLEAASVDVVVFCLSLMGTNIRDFVFEAARILKVGGTLKIAELESRFQGEDLSVESFIQNVEKFGFKNSWKDLKKDFFYFIDFTKTSEVKKKKKLPDLALKACLYKKR